MSATFHVGDALDLEALATALSNWEDWEPGDGHDFIPILAAAYFVLETLTLEGAG